eukprot:TRINITY_DN5188_c0_g1_i5.p1 TRINITY_DN5188_c0_g1~~TRINITY_DN5188_c0_g1_i5.p1  ORF type:complete len:136 (+),score=9.89 TRINITY_DN5188_c0_g1_i5:296-703(+)
MAAISIAVTTDKSADSSTNQPSQNTHLPLQAKVKNTGKMKEKLKKRLYVGGCSILFIPLILWHIGIHWRSSCEISICCESFKLYEDMKLREVGPTFGTGLRGSCLPSWLKFSFASKIELRVMVLAIQTDFICNMI